MNRIKGIRTVTFDADGTLWNFEKVMLHSLAITLTELQKTLPDTAGKLTVDRMIEIRNQVATEHKGKTTSLEHIRHEAFKQTLREIGKPDNKLATRLTELFLKHRYQDIQLYGDVRQTLKTLQKNYTLGIISNGNCYPDQCGLKNTFTFTIFAQDHHAGKPDPKLFQIALQRAACTRHQLIHIGDSLEEDVEGAIRAGVKSVWLNRNHQKNNLTLKPDWEISSLTELLKIL
jgi:putative hydrolase of the HAD superfamily